MQIQALASFFFWLLNLFQRLTSQEIDQHMQINAFKLSFSSTSSKEKIAQTRDGK